MDRPHITPPLAADPAAPSAARRRNRLADAAAGAAAGTILWICAILLGIPSLAGFSGDDFTLVAAALGALAAVTRLRTWLYVKTAIVVLVTALIAYTPVIDAPARSLVDRDRRPPAAAGAVVVLGADVTPDSLLYEQSLDRMLSGVELVRSGAAPLLVVPGNVREDGARRIPATPDQRRLIALAGIDSTRVLVSESVYSTRDEAVRAQQLLTPRGVRHIYLVTSPVHSRRACRTFARVGFVVTCWPSHSRDVPLTPGALRRSTDRLAAFRLWLYEQVATAVYHTRGWV